MRLLLLPSLVLVAAAGCRDGRAEGDDHAPEPPPSPASCREIPAGGDLAAAIAEASDGEVLCLAPGDHFGPVTIDRPLTLWGPRDAVVRSASPGSIITIAAPHVTVSGMTIDGTGCRFVKLDAAVHVTSDDDAVLGVEVVHSVYGILVEKAHRATIRGNHVRGDAATAMGMRGDTIRLWETFDSVLEDNLVEDGRDMVVWYSSRNRVAGNRALRGRYGTHFMYSDDNVVENNRYLHGVVGVFVMYSHRMTLRNNAIADTSGVSGMAIGLKDSGDIHVVGNALIRDATGVFVDQTPGTRGEVLEIRRNAIRQTDVAIAFHTTPHDTTIEDNDFADDQELARQDIGGVDITQATWRDNYYDDYAGYDLDGDGTGDLPFEARDASEALIARHPTIAFFRGSPVMGMVDAASTLLPLWEPKLLLVDPSPRMAPHDLEEILHAR